MGIPKFWGTLIRNLKIRAEDFKPGTFPSKISGVMIDMNDLLYFSVSSVYLTPPFKPNPKKINYRNSRTEKQLHDLVIKTIVNRLDMYLEVFEAEDYFILSVDGPAPLAKIAQQRIRRFNVSGDPKDPNIPYFDTAMLSPGTEMMEKIHLGIKKWFDHNIIKDRFPRFASYSSFHEPGEGEHKMIQILLRNKDLIYPSGKEPEGLHMICGQDSDLLMLGSLIPYNNVVWNREDRDKEALSGAPDSNFIMVDPFKRGIYKSFMRDRTDIDFVLSYFVFGNDFIPKNPVLKHAGDTLQHLSDAYRKNGKRLVDLKTGKIIRSNFIGFLSHFESLEQENLNEVARKYNPSKQLPYDILMKNYKEAEGKGNRKEVDIESFKQDWYQRMFNNYNEHACKSCQGKPYDDPEEFMKDMMENYLEMLQWNLDYYLGNKVSWNFQYRFYFAPLLSDVGSLSPEGEIKRNIDDWKEDSSILRQLIMISHPSKIRSFIPSKFYPILEEESVKELSPDKPVFFMDGNTKDQAHLFTSILPLVSQEVYEEAISKHRSSIPERMEVHHNPSDIYIKDLTPKSRSRTVKMTYDKFTWSDKLLK